MSPANLGDSSDTLEEETATHFSILPWEIPGTGEPGGLHSLGLQRVMIDHTCTHSTKKKAKGSFAISNNMNRLGGYYAK